MGRGINRPKHKKSQKENYSGKKKTHTVKKNIITQMNLKVVFLSDTHEEA
ncbi:MAG: transposase family protein [Alkalinema sp. CAN_BIN05]|nr:transposase family protein [Alkalinema sp. CAN_BIN05]